jgi:urease accessory protein
VLAPSCRRRLVGLPADHVVLAYDDRHRRRFAMQESGLTFLLDLPEAAILRAATGWCSRTGASSRCGRAEPLLRCAAAIIIWRGSRLASRQPPRAGRHRATRLLMRPDHVIAAMYRAGATVTALEAPFQPEGGAYAAEHAHLRMTTTIQRRCASAPLAMVVLSRWTRPRDTAGYAGSWL